jgi:hypothetical protein
MLERWEEKATSNKEDSGIQANYGLCTSHKHKLTLDAPPFKLGLR